MKRLSLLIAFIFILVHATWMAVRVPVVADSLVGGDPKLKVSPKAPLKAYAFNLKDVRLLEGPFRDAMLRDQKFLLSVDPERLLHMFRVTAGLPSSAKPYGGW